MTDYRKAYGLPQRYFLSLGRMVEKKNLSTLVEAYARFARASVEKHGAGSGEHGEKKHGAGSMEQRANLTENCKLNTEHCPPGLVFVGSGELESVLREQARGLGLRVIDRSDWKAGQRSHRLTQPTDRETALRQIDAAESANRRWPQGKQPEANKSERLAADRTGESADSRVIAYGPSTALPPVPAVGHCPTKQTDDCELTTENSVESDRGAVYFYGFRQIEENPVFYALAEAFVLPSLKEEWGLVVNEAMAAGLPVIVSRTAGCAEDLLPGSEQVTGDVWRVTSGEQEADARAGRSMEHGAGPPARRPYGSERSMESGENAASLNVAYGPSPAIRPTVQRSTLNSLEERSNGFVFDPSSVDALSEALRRIADPLNPQRSTLNAAAMGCRSREIVAKFSCENFARQALRAAEAASA